MNTYSMFQIKNKRRPDIKTDRQRMNQSLYLIYASQLGGFSETIEATRDILSQEIIWPDQCERVVNKFGGIKKAAANIARVARKQDNNSLGHKHYSTFVSASYFCEQIDRFIEFIREYRELPDQASAKKSKRTMISSIFHHLDVSLLDLMKELDNTLKNS